MTTTRKGTKVTPKVPGTAPQTPRSDNTDNEEMAKLKERMEEVYHSGDKPVPSAKVNKEELYIRNAGLVPVRIRAARKRGETYDYALAPRGMRGDTAPIFEEDVAYLINETNNEGLYEILNLERAHTAMSQQITNQQHFHPAQAALRDEHGKPVTGITVQHEGGGDTVAQIVTPQADGTIGHRQIQIQR